MITTGSHMLERRRQLLAYVHRWYPADRRALLAGIAANVISLEEAAEAHSLSVAEIEEWRRKFKPQPKVGVSA
jgi:hypothetical protein